MASANINLTIAISPEHEAHARTIAEQMRAVADSLDGLADALSLLPVGDEEGEHLYNLGCDPRGGDRDCD